jgi:hypothetical protein
VISGLQASRKLQLRVGRRGLGTLPGCARGDVPQSGPLAVNLTFGLPERTGRALPRWIRNGTDVARRRCCSHRRGRRCDGRRRWRGRGDGRGLGRWRRRCHLGLRRCSGRRGRRLCHGRLGNRGRRRRLRHGLLTQERSTGTHGDTDQCDCGDSINGSHRAPPCNGYVVGRFGPRGASSCRIPAHRRGGCGALLASSVPKKEQLCLGSIETPILCSG